MISGAGKAEEGARDGQEDGGEAARGHKVVPAEDREKDFRVFGLGRKPDLAAADDRRRTAGVVTFPEKNSALCSFNHSVF